MVLRATAFLRAGIQVPKPELANNGKYLKWNFGKSKLQRNYEFQFFI